MPKNVGTPVVALATFVQGAKLFFFCDAGFPDHVSETKVYGSTVNVATFVNNVNVLQSVV